MKTKFAVHYFAFKRDQLARFSNEREAREFGKFISRRELSLVEMTDKTGLVGQWDCGSVTSEFAHAEPGK